MCASVVLLPPPAQVDVGDKIKLGRVLALKQGDSFQVGRPYLDDVDIEAEIIEELRGPKVRGAVLRGFWCGQQRHLQHTGWQLRNA